MAELAETGRAACFPDRRALPLGGHMARVSASFPFWTAVRRKPRENPNDMLAWALKKILGTSHEREVKKLRPLVAAINDLEPEISELTDDELKGMTAEFKEKLDNGATLDDILIHVFNHSTYHRGQVARLVTDAGGQRALTDYIAFFRTSQS